MKVAVTLATRLCKHWLIAVLSNTTSLLCVSVLQGDGTTAALFLTFQSQIFKVNMQSWACFNVCMYVGVWYSFRAAKTSARKLISDSILTTPQGRGDGEGSDDSLVGDHSPFVRQAAKRWYMWSLCAWVTVITASVIADLVGQEFQCWIMMMMTEVCFVCQNFRANYWSRAFHMTESWCIKNYVTDLISRARFFDIALCELHFESCQSMLWSLSCRKRTRSVNERNKVTPYTVTTVM